MFLKSIFITHFAIISIFSMSISPLIEANNSTIGFTIDLIHRDSPQSPFHDPSLLPSQRLTNALRRSLSRAHHLKLKSTKELPPSDIVSVNGEYIMMYSIGTPPVPSLAVADTGSDLTWTQCPPCDQCFKQKLPLFQPNRSSTYKPVSCNSTLCHTLISDATCPYSASYGDHSFSHGDLATDTITLGSTGAKTVSLPNIIFGCGRRNGGTFSSEESGIVGLGGGKVSLVSQLGPLIGGKFSYCLVSYLSNASKSSKLNFGNNAEVSGEGVVSTPIVVKKPQTVFYYLTLEGVSVGNETFSASDNSKADEEGNIIIDSGTTLTFLPPGLYTKVENAVVRRIKLQRVLDPQGILKLCFFSKTDISVPDITVHFKGADLKLKSDSTFVRTSNYSVCLAFRSADTVPIYGNLAQMDFLVGYDLEKKIVSFKPTDCSKS